MSPRKAIAKPRHKAIDKPLVDRLMARLASGETSKEVLDAVEQFGQFMIDEALGRVSIIESKGISLLGWASALLGFLLLDESIKRQSVLQSEAIGPLLSLAILSAAISLGAAVVATYIRNWGWPGIQHWFCESEFSSERTLRVVHLKALLETYQVHEHILHQKAVAVQISQWALAIWASFVAARLLF